MRTIGTQAMGLRTPIIRVGDDLIGIIVQSLEEACTKDNVTLRDYDVLAVTEAVVARAQGNYATIEQISQSVTESVGAETIGVVFPIASRNRFAVLLEGIAKNAKKVVVQLSYPDDEVGNGIISLDQIDQKGVNPYSDNFTEAEFRAIFGYDTKHRFTDIDYIECYKSLGDNIEIVFSNDPKYILEYTKDVIVADVHSRHRTKRILKASGANRVVGLDEILTHSVDGSGFNPDFGLLGSNKSKEGAVKLFPRDCEAFVQALQTKLKERFGKHIETMIYGDGAFKDPQGGIWELADPVVSPGFTAGLRGTPNEVKLKYIADNAYADLSGKDLENALRDSIRSNDLEPMGKVNSLGTTPRQVVELLGSLCDLISGSGDKGTPVVLVQGYFDNYADEEQ